LVDHNLTLAVRNQVVPLVGHNLALAEHNLALADHILAITSSSVINNHPSLVAASSLVVGSLPSLVTVPVDTLAFMLNPWQLGLHIQLH